MEQQSPQGAVAKRDGDKIHSRLTRSTGAAGGVVTIGFDVKDPYRFDASATK